MFSLRLQVVLWLFVTNRAKRTSAAECLVGLVVAVVVGFFLPYEEEEEEEEEKERAGRRVFDNQRLL